MRAAVELRVADCVRDFGVPQPTEWQRIGNQIEAEFLFARAYSVSVHFLRNKIEDAGLKLVGSKLRALSGAERRLLDTVLIHNTVPC
jgi:hypothetical protein